MFKNNMHKISALLATFGLGLLAIVAVLIAINALLRKIIDFSFIGITDITENAMIISLACCFPIMAVKQSAISARIIDYLYPKYAWLFEKWGQFILTIFLFLLSVKLTQYSYNLFLNGEYSWTLKIPSWIAWSIASMLLWLSFIIQTSYTFEGKRP